MCFSRRTAQMPFVAGFVAIDQNLFLREMLSHLGLLEPFEKHSGTDSEAIAMPPNKVAIRCTILS